MGGILEPLYWLVSTILVSFHKLWTAVGMDPASGWAWSLSIVGLVVVIRILLIPLFVKQIRSMRGLQMLQPEIKKIQEKYKGRTDRASREKMAQEQMALYRAHGTNPFASCLPILAQAPIFFALFHVLNGIGARPPQGRGVVTDALAQQAADATVFGAPISAKFIGAGSTTVQVVTVVLIVLMSATTFLTQRQLTMKNMPPSAMTGQFAHQQKILLYVFPLVFAVSGVNFPIGVLLYWLTTNLWSMGQQFYVIRRMPAPGSAAALALEERRARQGGAPTLLGRLLGRRSPAGSDAPGDEASDGGTAASESAQRTRQRVQPRRQPRGKRQGGGPPVGGSPRSAADYDTDEGTDESSSDPAPDAAAPEAAPPAKAPAKGPAPAKPAGSPGRRPPATSASPTRRQPSGNRPRKQTRGGRAS